MLKTTYREITKHWQSYSFAAPLQKQRFLEAYTAAGSKAFTKKNIESGFRRASIWPINPERLQEDRVLETERRPTTPEFEEMPFNDSYRKFTTPHKSADISQQMRALEGQVRSLQAKDRDNRQMLKSSGKGLDNLTELVAALREQIRHLEAEIDELTPFPRKRIKRDDASKLFVDRKQVWESQKGLAKRQAEMIVAKKQQVAAQRRDPNLAIEVHDAAVQTDDN